jgi:HEAT repeat protein
MNIADDVFDRLAQLLEDSDVAVRTDAAIVLGTCRRFDALQLLYKAEDDPSPSVREAASNSIEQIADRAARITDAPLTGDLY